MSVSCNISVCLVDISTESYYSSETNSFSSKIPLPMDKIIFTNSFFRNLEKSNKNIRMKNIRMIEIDKATKFDFTYQKFLSWFEKFEFIKSFDKEAIANILWNTKQEFVSIFYVEDYKIFSFKYKEIMGCRPHFIVLGRGVIGVSVPDIAVKITLMGYPSIPFSEIMEMRTRKNL